MNAVTERTGRWKPAVAFGASVAMLATIAVVQTGPTGLSASSHREAPLIAGDPRADNTDVYAFVSPDDPDTVTMIASWLPFAEPNGGPNFYPWAEDTRYNINIDHDGDAVADLVYTWTFTTITKDPGQFLNNTGPFDSVTDPELNVYQTYDLVVRDLMGTLLDETDDAVTPLLSDAIAAPSAAGSASTPDYQALVDEAVASGTAGDLRSYAGQSDDPFFLDLRVFDLLYGADASEVGEDTLAGYNVNTIAVQVPKDLVALGQDATANPVIGVWSTTDRPTSRNADGSSNSAEFTQVSRLGNPLVNEVVIPLALKDTFNAVDPTVDATVPAVVESVTMPILPPLVSAIYGLPVPGDNNGDGDNSDPGDEPRTDLVEIFLQGVSVANGGLGDPDQHPALAADLNSLALNAGVDQADIVPSEMLRLNMAVPPTASPQALGVLAGDLQGFPNGRRLTDDVVDIALRVVEGAVYEGGADVSALATLDSVDRNDREFSDSFPYVALPHLDSVTNGTERTPRAPEIVQIDPVRVLDTRAATQVGYSGTKPVAGQQIEVDVNDVVPEDASAIVVTVSSVQTEANGFVTVYADCDDDLPNAATVNPIAGGNIGNLAITEVGDDGTICVFTSTSTELIVDVSAYHPTSSSFVPNAPERVLETRANVAGGPVGFSGATPSADDVVVVEVTGTPGAALPDDVDAVVLNVTSIGADGTGFVTAYPCDEDRPVTANLNMPGGDVRGNLLVSKVSADGTVCLYTTVGTELVADLQGSYPAGSGYVAVVPERLLETRAGVAGGRIGYSGDKPIAGELIEVRVTGTGSTMVPAGAGTVYLNLAAIQAETNGYFAVFECGTTQPETASGVYSAGVNNSMLVAASVGDSGRVCVYTSAAAHITADVMGFFPNTQLVGN
ncbi:MAG: DUF4331 domain-containing protein [Ilumatobacter sp.]|uniref:DUF4331 domain-containing protein n=1 Tax=Ilumatobacter sp. TaxID=1967498 RepID=UPI003919B5AF